MVANIVLGNAGGQPVLVEIVGRRIIRSFIFLGQLKPLNRFLVSCPYRPEFLKFNLGQWSQQPLPINPSEDTLADSVAGEGHKCGASSMLRSRMLRHRRPWRYISWTCKSPCFIWFGCITFFYFFIYFWKEPADAPLYTPRFVLVETPVDTEILVDQWCVNFPVWIEGRDMPGNLYFLDMHYFYVILGMDWLSKKVRNRIGSFSAMGFLIATSVPQGSYIIFFFLRFFPRGGISVRW